MLVTFPKRFKPRPARTPLEFLLRITTGVIIGIGMIALVLSFAGKVPSLEIEPYPEELFSHRYSQQEMLQDIEFLLATYEEVHPDLYYHTSREEVENLRNGIEANLQEPLTRLQFFPKVARLASHFGDGHTSINFPWEERRQHTQSNALVFPVDLKFAPGEPAVVNHVFGGWTIPPKDSRILSINEIAMDSIQSALISTISGERSLYRCFVLESQFRPLFWAMFHCQSPYHIEYEPPGAHGVVETVDLDGLPLEQIFQEQRRRFREEERVPWSYQSDPETGIGTIQLRSLEAYIPFQSFLVEAFTIFQRDSIHTLVIDVRGNYGGNSSLGDALLSYITDQPFTQVSRMDVKVSPQVRELYRSWMLWPEPFHATPAWRSSIPENMGDSIW